MSKESSDVPTSTGLFATLSVVSLLVVAVGASLFLLFNAFLELIEHLR